MAEVICDRLVTKVKGKFYKMGVKPTMLYGLEKRGRAAGGRVKEFQI